MDIKSKKSKLVISFTAWLIGITLLIFNGFLLVTESLIHGDMGRQVSEVIDGDYQNTREFAACMSNYLNTFLAMSVNGPLYNISTAVSYEDFFGEYDYASLEEAIVSAEATGTADAIASARIVEELPEEQAVELSEEQVAEKKLAEEMMVQQKLAESADTGYEINTDAGYEKYNYTPYEPLKEIETDQNIQDAQAYNESLQNDKNILYRIEHDGQLLYTNDETLGMYGEDGFTMPEGGYNYLLYFDGEQVKAVKDGKEINLYGDGYYRDGSSSWEIPGYRNFTVDNSIESTRICIAVNSLPSMNVEKNYSSTGGSYGNTGNIYNSNSLYEIQETLNSDRDSYFKWIYVTLFAFFLLMVSFVFRREKKEADQAIAGVTGKIPYEFKIAALAALLYGIILLLVLICNKYRNYGYFEFAGWNRELVEIMIRETAAGVEVRALTAFIIVSGFSLIWLFCNDAHYNKKPWRKSLTVSVTELLRTSMLRQPLGKRMVRRQSGVLLMQIILGLIMWAAAFMGGRFYLASDTVVIIISICLVIMWFFQFSYARQNKKAAMELELLVNQIETVHEGRLENPVKAEGNSDLKEAVNNLNDIQRGMKIAMDEQMKSERMKVELIANVSHDIKTPLTSIISYVELLKQEENLPEHVREYISILENKSQRLKTMVQDVFEVSKAASGELPVHMENLDFGKLLRQTLADMSEQILASDVTVKTEIPEEDIMIHADGERLYRVFQNLVQNALKYSLEGSRIYITLGDEAEVAIASVKNTSREELAQETDYTERFTRGDKSRSDGGSGLGLSIARSFTETCGGRFQVETIADLFVATVSFPKAIEVSEETETSDSTQTQPVRQ